MLPRRLPFADQHSHFQQSLLAPTYQSSIIRQAFWKQITVHEFLTTVLATLTYQKTREKIIERMHRQEKSQRANSWG